jgi:hypothetical protein
MPKKLQKTPTCRPTSPVGRQDLPFIWLLILVFICKEAAWLCLTPPSEAPDELAHYAYLETLYYEQKLPELGKTMFSQRVQFAGMGSVSTNSQMGAPLDAQNAQSAVAESGTLAIDTTVYKPGGQINWIAQHPPLYYLILLPAYSVLPHADVLFSIFILRFTSIFLGAITLYFSYKTLQKMLPGKPVFGAAGTAALAFLPMFSFIGAVLNNDNLVMALSSILIYLLVNRPAQEKSPKTGYSWSVKTGLVLALLALTKTTALPLLIVVFVLQAINIFTAKNTRERNQNLINTAIIFGIPLVISGWWYLRNFFIFHAFLPELRDAVAINPKIISDNPALLTMFPEINPQPVGETGFFDFLIVKGFIVEYFKNIWGTFGRFFVQLSVWQYAVIAVFTVTGLCGLIIKWVRERLIQRSKAIKWLEILQNKQMVFLLVLVTYLLLITWKIYLISSGRGFLGAMHGRYFFPALLPFFYFILRGWSRILPESWLQKAFLLFTVMFIFNDMTSLFYVLIPAFY